jgi:tetratricopeptide (TPR) repeat protein
MVFATFRRQGSASLVTLLMMVIISTSISGCKTARKSVIRAAQSLKIIEHTTYRPPQEAPDIYRRGVATLNKAEFAEALSIFDQFLQDEPASSWTQAVTLNSGRALEGLGRWGEAGERYRRVILACEGIAPKLQAVALYRLSFVHEAQGEDQKTVATLNDLLNRQSQLPPEIARAELPARLAAAYARVGNFDRAMEFYQKAETAIVQLKRAAQENKQAKQEEDVPEWLPRTLYFMGTMATRRADWSAFETELRPLARGQKYLLQSAELGENPWSDRAAQDLMTTYNELWMAVQNSPAPQETDPLLAKRAIQNKQWDRSALVLEHLQELKSRLAPEARAQENDTTKRIAGFIADLEKKIWNLLGERPAGEGLTAEALERKRRVRGRVVSPDNSLEQKFLEGARKQLPTDDPNI